MMELAPKWQIWKHRRYIMAIMVFFGFFNVYTLRTNLSIAIVAMTSDRFETLENGTQINLGPEFKWNNAIQGYILSSFFYGYICTQFLGGYAAKKYGGKLIFGGGIAVTALLTVITPWVATLNVYLLIALRIIEGLFEGASYPSIQVIWAAWAPPLERTSLTTIGYTGSFFGTVIAMPLSAYLAEIFGWRSIFFFFGTVGLIWFLLWVIIISNSPGEDKWISKQELKYIQSSLSDNHDGNSKMSIPWKEIIKSKAVWAICVANFCENWGFFTFLTQLPKFLKEMFQFNLGKSGFLSGLPYLASTIMTPIAGQTADFLLRRGVLTVTQCRKIWNCGGFITQCVFVIALTMVTNGYLAVGCVAVAVSIGAFSFAAYCVNPLDIAPPYASILLGISNTFGTMPGIISPILAGYIVSDEPEINEWRIIFIITGILYFAGAIYYTLCASGEVQPWAKTVDLPDNTSNNTSANENSLRNIA